MKKHAHEVMTSRSLCSECKSLLPQTQEAWEVVDEDFSVALSLDGAEKSSAASAAALPCPSASANATAFLEASRQSTTIQVCSPYKGEEAANTFSPS